MVKQSSKQFRCCEPQFCLSPFSVPTFLLCVLVQVHRAKLFDGTEVAMKIQYPGVADSVESDLKNLQRLVQLTNILPPGLYIDEIIKVRIDLHPVKPSCEILGPTLGDKGAQ